MSDARALLPERRAYSKGVINGAHTLTAEDPLPPDLRDALAQIN